MTFFPDMGNITMNSWERGASGRAAIADAWIVSSSSPAPAVASVQPPRDWPVPRGRGGRRGHSLRGREGDRRGV